MEAKVSDSMVEMRELILPNDTNLLEIFLGAGFSLDGYSRSHGCLASFTVIQATAAIDSVDFKQPVHGGETIVLKAKLTWVGRTSMEVLVEACSENYLTGETKFTNRAYFIFVSLDENGKPRPVPKLILETDEERREYQEALKRREERLKRRQITSSCSQCEKK